MSKPTIRLYLNMARTGGKVISKCLGSMDGVVLLSEIHPLGLETYSPVTQGDEWFGLFTQDDKQRLAATGSVNYLDLLALLRQRCEDRGETLVIRDWSHLDFTGVPFTSPPAYQSTHRKFLEKRFTVITTASVRHPIDQWLSLRRVPIMQGKIDLETYLEGYLRFAELCARVGFIRYEEFARDPDTVLKTLCANLDISFDSGYRDRWVTYTKITGYRDSRRPNNEIKPLPRRRLEPGLIDKFAANGHYRRAIEILGYGHPK